MGKPAERIFSVLIAIICGFTAANMYYIQPLTPFIQRSLSISYGQASLLYSCSLVGNAASLIFVIPVGDFHSKKKLIEKLLLTSIASLFLFYLSKNYFVLAILAFFIGIGASMIPLIISTLSSRGENGVNNVGIIMAGVLFGILFSRFTSSLFATFWGWKSVYLFSAFIMILSYSYLRTTLPSDVSSIKKTTYINILSSNVDGLFKNRPIRYYSANGFVAMCLFAAYWNNVSSYLKTDFSMGQLEIGIFSLTGVAGASSALFSNVVLHFFKNNDKIFSVLSLTTLAIMMFFTHYFSIAIIGTLLIDAFIQLSHVNNQRKLYQACKGNEARAASCYMTAFILGGAFGGGVSSYIYHCYGWHGVLVFCAVVCLLPLSLKRIDASSKNF